MPLPFVDYPFTAVRHRAVVPALRSGLEQRRHPVVVVGGGPVGLCTALGLAMHDIPVVLLEADDSVCIGSRAICISRRSLEIIDRLGALEGFLKAGLPWTGGRSYFRDVEVLRFSMPADENQRLPPMVNLAQYRIEQILLERAEQLRDRIEIRWQTRLTGIETSASGSRLTVATPELCYALEADWVVAADGGRSFVRDALGLALEGTSYEGRYVIVDIRLRSDRPTERLAYFDPPCNPGSTVLVHKQPDDVWRIDYQLREGEDPDDAIRPENVMPRVESLLDMMGERGAWSPIWIGIYKANALTLPRYRAGRVLLAGDAAHLMPIFGVRGANSGIDDADNLSWKLAFVVKGAAHETLLDSYSAERVAAAHENLQHGTKSTEFMAPPSFAFDLMRTAVLSLASRHPEVRSLINPRQTSAVTYVDSPLNAAEGAPLLDPGPAPGAVLSECPVTLVVGGARSQGHITSLLQAAQEPGFTALLFADTPEIPRHLLDLKEALHRRGVPFAVIPVVRRPVAESVMTYGWDHTGRLFPMYGADSGAVYVVRPDGHVLGRRRDAPAPWTAAAILRALGFSTDQLRERHDQH
jgi:3-(3-hydroxy-phenyl)propionate hydroxylase